MSRIGLTIDELVASAVTAQYAAHVDGLRVIEGEVLALAGPRASALREKIALALPGVLHIDGAAVAAAGSLRIHAVQASRVGIRALSVSDPLPAGLDAAARDLVLADLASLANADLTVVVDFADASAAALVADRIAVVGTAVPDRVYPVVAPRPRMRKDVVSVTARALARMTAA